MPEISKLESVERWARILSAIAIPVVIAFYANLWNQAQQAKTLQRDYVQMALAILQNTEVKAPELRAWAEALLEETSPTPLSHDLAHKLAWGLVTMGGRPSRNITETVAIFSQSDTLLEKNGQVTAISYLHALGAHLVDIIPRTSKIVLKSNSSVYEGLAVLPTISQNFLTQMDTGGQPSSYTIVFDRAVESVTVTRASLFAASPSGVTHPTWAMTALDEEGAPLQTIGEPLIRHLDRRNPVRAQDFTVHAPHHKVISGIRITADPRDETGKPFAAFDSVVIEQLVLARVEGQP